MGSRVKFSCNDRGGRGANGESIGGTCNGGAHLAAEYTEDKAEQEAAWCQQAVSSIVNAMAKNIRIWAKSERWLNANINKRRKAVRRDIQRIQNYEEASRAEV